MWQPMVDKMQRKSESERLERAEDYISQLKETIIDLKERVEELEKANDK